MPVTASSPSVPDLRTTAATPDRWDDVVTVFGKQGDASRCWCQWFAVDRPDLSKATAPQSRERLEHRVRQADQPPPGVLAFQGDVPVGWLRVGVLQELPRLVDSRTAGPTLRAQSDAWMVSCFVVRVGYRRHGVSGALLRGAIELARQYGVPALLGHPLDVTALTRRPDSADLYMGTLSVFTRAGFTEIARTSPVRAVVRLDLSAAA